MISFLSRIFIKDYRNTSSPSVRQAYGMLCGIAGIFFNILLFIGKFLAGMVSNSIAVTADAFNNLSDAGSSLITLIGFKMAGQKPDLEHPFGHGRIEYLSGALVSLAILLMAFELIRTSFSKILHPEEVEFSLMTVLILVASIAVKLYMGYYNRTIGAKIGSAAMKATSTDSLSDTLATFAVLLSTLAAHFFGLKIDGWCGLLVGIFILYAGISAAKDTISPLLGQQPQPEFVNKIEEIVMSYEGVLGIHDLIVHDYGPGRVMVSLHAEVPASGDLLDLHDMIDNIEHRLKNTLHCDAVIHMDPVCNEDALTQELKAKALCFIRELDPCVTLHDFRLVKGPTHTNILFDVVLPFEFKISDQEVQEFIAGKFSGVAPNYYTVIEIDRSYT